MFSFKVKEKINDEIYVEKQINPYITFIYPNGKKISLGIDIKKFPKVGNKFNSVYNYEEIKIDGIDETGFLYGYIKLGYALKQLPYKK